MFDYSSSQPGHFYAVGVGPGSKDLLTLRAVRLIESADVIIAPRSRRADESLAMRAIQDHIRGQEVVDHVYAMERDEAKTLSTWMRMADLVVERCSAGRSVVQITLGDPLIYSTSCYLLGLLKERMDDSHVHVVPGISAFQAASCLFAEALTIQEDRVLLMPATDLAHVDRALGECETLILYKAGRQIDALADLLDRKGLLQRACLACYAEQEGREFITRDLRSGGAGTHGYMATVVVHIGRRRWNNGD